MNFAGDARRLTRRDVEVCAESIGCEYAALRAVLDVESRGAGFDNKRRPIILFEPHVFYRNLPPGSAKLKAAMAAGLAYPIWGEKPYPKGQDAQYDRLSRAIEIDEEAAFRAVSVGMGQVLGENYFKAGCPSARALFHQAMVSERQQLEHMISFIRSSRLDDDLRELRWESFARGYNGPGQVKKYAGLLRRSYEKWAKIAAKPREELTASDLRAAGSTIVQATSSAKAAYVVAAGTAAGAKEMLDRSMDTVDSVSSSVDRASDVVDSVVTVHRQAKMAFAQVHSWDGLMRYAGENWQWIVGGLLAVICVMACAQIWFAIQRAERARVLDARDGLNERF